MGKPIVPNHTLFSVFLSTALERTTSSCGLPCDIASTPPIPFVPCTAFGYAAQALAQKHKGDPVLAVGRLKTETWNKDGANHSRLVLLAQAVQLMGKANLPSEGVETFPALTKRNLSDGAKGR